MKWSEFKEQVENELAGSDPDILYIDINDAVHINIDNTKLGLIIVDYARPVEEVIYP